MKFAIKTALACVLAIFAANASASGQYDGVYQVSGQSGYTVVYQSGNQIIAIDLTATAKDGTSYMGTWDHTMSGALNGNVATVNISDHVHIQTSFWTFNSDGSITVTTPSCSPAAGYMGSDACDMLGKTITVQKIL